MFDNTGLDREFIASTTRTAKALEGVLAVLTERLPTPPAPAVGLTLDLDAADTVDDALAFYLSACDGLDEGRRYSALMLQDQVTAARRALGDLDDEEKT